MEPDPKSRRRYHFGVFQLDLASGELYKHGTRIKLQDQPFRVLQILLDYCGEVVTRDELRKRLWDHDTYVDFDHSLNISINKLREALGDSAANPRFIETLPKRGYRFLSPVSAEDSSLSVSVASPTQTNASTVESIQAPDAQTGLQTTEHPESPIPEKAVETEPPRRRKFFLVAAAMVLAALGAWLWWVYLGGGAAKGKVMLAVLPFDDLAPDQHDAYFIAGLHDEMIAQLGQLSPMHLGVIARTSVAQYANQHTPLEQIGRELHVDYVLEGTVRSVEGHLRVTAELVHVKDQTQLWVETYEPRMDNILAMQEDVARRVSAALSMEFLPEDQQKLRQHTTPNAEAYDAYLRGRFLWYQETRESLEGAVVQFQKAIALDPNYAPAYVGLADAYDVMGGYGFDDPEMAFPKAKAAARRALEIAPGLSDAYGSMAFAAFYYDWNWSESEQLFRKALALNPNNQVAHEFYSSFLHAMGRLDEAQAENAVARKLDPISGWLHDDYGWMLLSRRRPEAAVPEFQKAIELTKFPAAHLSLAVAYSRLGKYREALTETQKAEELGGEPTRIFEVRGSVLALSGDLAGAQALVDRLRSGAVVGRVSPYSIALIYAAMGKKTEALEALEKAYREKDPWLVWTKVLVEWDALRAEPRFNDLMRRMNF